MPQNAPKRTKLRLSVRQDVLDVLEKLAASENRSLNNFIETKLIEVKEREGYRVGHAINPATPSTPPEDEPIL